MYGGGGVDNATKDCNVFFPSMIRPSGNLPLILQLLLLWSLLLLLLLVVVVVATGC